MRVFLAIGIVLMTLARTDAAEPLIVAHRGASADAPENTLPAFKLAFRQGADAIEGDFRLTADGQIVCIHDADTKRVAGAKLVVAKSTLQQLRTLDVGLWRGVQFKGTTIPTFAEVLAVVPAGKLIYVEVKGPATMVPRLLEEIGRSGLRNEQVVLIAFDAGVIRAAKDKAPQLKGCWLSGFEKDGWGRVTPSLKTILATLKQTGANGFSSSHEIISEPVVRRIQKEGYEYHVWTVDDLNVAKRFRRWGAGSITTNVPAYIKKGISPIRSR
ncbi:MAG: glycerophosphodiester phosphodiesterase [Candidatus Nealsonbacteria bacterium]|nr:glycerophosphodiester phosphodiesterase [Candidatus Nealsonbacteria bacterium]